jgi:lipoprotein-anchoring transpeptidase ErfK/SrfK
VKRGAELEKLLLWDPSPLPHKPHCLVLLTLVCVLLLSDLCSAETQSFRDEARSAADSLREISPPARLIEEYGNILATFDTADELSLKNKTDEAQKLYRLVLVEFSVFNKKLPPLDTSSIGPSPVPSPQPTSPVIQDAASANVTVGVGVRAEDVEEEESPISSPLMVGKEFVYTVKKSESLRMLGAKLGVGWRAIVRENDLDPKKPLEAGQELVINTRRIIPKTLREGILINIPDRTMYLFKDNKLEKTVPVALGMPTYQDNGDWRTPTGRFRIMSKVKNPTWHVPRSIQAEMKLNKRTVLTEVPPGSDNPLGKYALMTSLSGIMIHSTSRPESIYNFASHGCIRVNPKNMEEIYPEIPVHTNGEIVYQPVKLAFSDDGRVFIEVHGDIYKRFKKLEVVAKGLIIKNKAEQRVDWDKVRTLLRKQSGIPEDVTLEGPEREK